MGVGQGVQDRKYRPDGVQRCGIRHVCHWFYLGLAGMALFWVVMVVPLFLILARVL